jgi:hypothetical protein
MKAAKKIFVLGMFAFLCFTAVASATMSYSNWQLFHYATPTWPGIDPECAYNRASVDNGASPGATAYVLSQYTSSCNQNLSRPAGWLGVDAVVIRGTSGMGGVMCVASGWQYNNIDTWNWGYFVPMSFSGSCPTGQSYYGTSIARIWWSDWTNYVTSNWVDSPNLSF